MFMLKGMVGIFLVTGMIILVLVIMDKAGNRKKETEE
ncbi:MAG: sodium pump decarboxylase gamma subunit [Clostridia bacterium]|nr:sodium pump decarboxylase gamma subunit [Clostridia bacterium]